MTLTSLPIFRLKSVALVMAIFAPMLLTSEASANDYSWMTANSAANAVFEQQAATPEQMAAQRAAMARRQQGWQVTGGVGLIVSNDYRGADNARFIPIPFFDVRYKDFFFNPGQGLGFQKNFRDGKWSYGFTGAIAPQFGNRDADDIPGLPEVDFGVEARIAGRLGYDKWTLEVTGARSLFETGHEGSTLDATLRYANRIGTRGGFFAVGPGVRFISDRVANAFYDVRPEFVAASGLNAFNTNGGLEAVNLSGVLNLPIKGRWGVTVFGEAGVLVGDFRDSPVVETNFQGSLITALTYRF